MKDAFRELLQLIRADDCDVDALCRGAEYFSIPKESIRNAAAQLPFHHDLRYQGMRMLLAACVREFEMLFSEDARKQCEVTVPAPPFMLYALQNASGNIRFATGAFFAQIMLRGILLNREPLDFTGCSMRHCGLNRMRLELLRRPPIRPWDCQLQFGVICSECVKTGECGPEETACFSIPFPEEQRKSRAAAEHYYHSLCDRLHICPDCEDIRGAFGLYGRMVKAENRILALCSRKDRIPLFGNSLSLVQSVQLLITDRMEDFIIALELLAEELEDAPKTERQKRYYCYYIPFLQPGIDRRFRENGVTLTGNAAFLQTDRYMGLDLPGMTEAWLDNMANRASPEKQCAAIARAMADMDCEAYLTGFFSFDRRLGAVVPLQRKLLKEKYGIQTLLLDTDFWCENAMSGSPENRIDQLSG